MAEEKQDGQKTLVAFVVGLLIGGMLVWAFSGPSADAPETQSDDEMEVSSDHNSNDDDDDNLDDESNDEMEEEVATLSVGDGEVSVSDQAASNSISLDSATYPISEGWIGVREYNNENLGFILGVVRFSESQNLVPSEIILQRATTAGKTYAIVVFSEDGDFSFNLANDVQIDNIFDTFVAK